jgi:galactose mutarotase-like enzyme
MTERLEVEIRSADLALKCVPHHGNVVSSITVEGYELLWRRPSFEPALIERTLGAPGPSSIETFMDSFVGGWFQMFPSVGLPGTRGGAFALLHGEVARLPWTVIAQTPSSVATRVTTLRTPFEAERTLNVIERTISCTTKIRNRGREEAPYLWGEHPCFDRDIFAGGAIEIDRAVFTTPAPAHDPPNSRLKDGEQGAWPQAARADGAPFDAGVIPERPDGRHEHICVRPERGSVRITSPKLDRTVTLDFDPTAYQFILIWQNYRAPNGSCWGVIDTFSVEPSNNPGLYSDDAFSADSVLWLAPGEVSEATLSISVSDRMGNTGNV